MTRYSQSCAHGTGRSVARWPSKLTISLVLVAVHHFTAAAAIHAEADVAYVSQQAGADSGTLLDALRHDSISHIIVQQPVYDVRSEFATYQGKPLTVDRNITISGADGTDTILDLDFVASAIQLCSTCSLTFSNITVANERHGIGESIDFIAGGPKSGAVVQLVNSNKLRLACTAGADAAAVLTDTARSPRAGDAAKTQVASVQDATFQGSSFPGSLLLSDVAMDVPFETVEGWRGGAGGYAVVSKNVTRLCRSTVDTTCLSVSTPEACVTDQMDKMRNAQHKAAAGGGSKTSIVGIAVGVAVAGVVAIVLAVSAVFCYRRRQKQIEEQHDKFDDFKIGRNASVTYGAGRLPSMTGRGRMSSMTSRNGGNNRYNDEGFTEADGVDVEALRMFDSFIEGCNFIRAPLGFRKGWEVSKVMTSPSTDTMPSEERADIQLGQFLGAGSFGRVYKARWGGRDVAVKVIEHNSEASNAVESEVELMFQFSNHPNIVRAFYAITYTQNTLPSCGMGTSSSSSTAPARDAPNYMLNSSAGSSSNNRGGFASGGSGQRAALARLRSIPLQEIVVHEDGPCVHDTDQLPAAAAGKGTTAAAAAQQDDASYDSHDQSGITEASQARQLDAVDTANSSQQRQQQQQRPASNKPNNNATPGQSGALGSNLAVRGPPLGSKLESLNHSPYNRPSTDKVYSWMGGSSSGIGQQQQQGMYPSLVSSGPFPGTMGGVGWKKPGELVEPCKDMRAETWLVQEYCDLDTLGSVAADWKACDESEDRMLQRLFLLKDAAQGLKVLHSMNTVHGDLTARNVLVNSDKQAPYGMVAKLADLGLSRVIKLHRTHRTTNTVGTLSHMPPELLRYGHCSTAVDIYAFGVMMWELYTNKAAFNKLQYGQFYETVVLRNLRPLLPPNMPADYSLLMQHCWASDPLQRPNVDRVLQCLGLMISERQERLSELKGVTEPRISSAPLPGKLPRQPIPPHTNLNPHSIHTSFSGTRRELLTAMPDGTTRVRSCPGPGGVVAAPAAAALAAQAAAAAAAAVHEGHSEEDYDGSYDQGYNVKGLWGSSGGPEGLVRPYSLGSRSGLGCSTPSVSGRPPLPWLRRLVSDEFGTNLGPKEETWFV